MYWLRRRNLRQADLVRRLNETEKRLAKLAGRKPRLVQPNTISSIARGLHTQTRMLERIAEAVNAPFDEVLVSPERQRANEELERRIRDAVASVVRAPERSVSGYDKLESEIESAIRLEETNPPDQSAQPRQVRKHQRKK